MMFEFLATKPPGRWGGVDEESDKWVGYILFNDQVIWEEPYYSFDDRCGWNSEKLAIDNAKDKCAQIMLQLFNEGFANKEHGHSFR